MLTRRPRLRNLLHALHLSKPCTQTIEVELAALARHAAGKRIALEIGTFEGVSAVRIAKALASDGCLYCVDPWPSAPGKANPSYCIAQRSFHRAGVEDRLKILRDYCANVEASLPASVDFAFIDGDHSWEGIETDWRIVAPRVRPGGILCLHDSIVPPSELWREFGSSRFFAEVISKDPGFELIETVHSLAVLRKR